MAYVHRYATHVLLVDSFILFEPQHVLSLDHSKDSLPDPARCKFSQLLLLAAVSSRWAQTAFLWQDLKRCAPYSHS